VRPNVGVSRAAGDGRERADWQHELTPKSRAQVGAAPAASVERVVGRFGAFFSAS
jgi:hypothetical protein